MDLRRFYYLKYSIFPAQNAEASSALTNFFKYNFDGDDDFRPESHAKYILKKGVHAGIVKECGEHFQFLWTDMKKISLAAILTAQLMSEKGDWIRPVLDYGNKNRPKIHSFLKKNEWVSFSLFFLIKRTFSSNYCASILAFCILSEESNAQEFFFNTLQRVRIKEWKAVQEIQEDYFMDTNLLDIYGLSKSIEMDFERALILDYFLERHGIKTVYGSIGLVIIQNLYQIYVYLSFLKGEFPYLRGNQKSKIKEATVIIKKFLKGSINEDSVTANIASLYQTGYDRSDKFRLGIAFAASNWIAEKKEIESDAIWEICNLSALIASLTQNYYKYSRESLLYFLSYEKDEEPISTQEDSCITTQEKELTELKNKIVALEKQNCTLRAELQKEGKKTSHYAAENERLRLQITSNNNQKTTEITLLQTKEEESEISYEEAIEFLSQMRIIVIGGHSNWIQQMQRHFPNWTYITDNGRQLPKYQYVDAVVFNTNYMHHCLFNKYMSFCRTGNVPTYLLNTNNVEQVIMQIYHQFH